MWWLLWDWAADAAIVLFVGYHIGAAQTENQSAVKTASAEPHAPIAKPQSGGRQLVIEADSNNQCYIEAFANGERFRFLADTGAAGIFFTMADVRKLGVNPSSLSFDHTYEEWGGKVKGAHVRLREFRIAGLVLKDVEAVIDETGNRQSPLLGAPILKAMNFQVRNGSCVLTLPERATALNNNSRSPAVAAPSEVKQRQPGMPTYTPPPRPPGWPTQ